jgi:hypothetical protein
LSIYLTAKYANYILFRKLGLFPLLSDVLAYISSALDDLALKYNDDDSFRLFYLPVYISSSEKIADLNEIVSHGYRLLFLQLIFGSNAKVESFARNGIPYA